MIKSLEELSQILTTTRISASQEEQILTIIKNLFASLEVIKEEEFHELHPQEDLKAFCNHPFQPIGETKESWTKFDGEPPLELKIKEFLICLSEDPPCTNETSYSKEDDLRGMIEGDMESGLNKDVNQERQDYIELWFQMTIRLKHHSLLHQLFTSSSKQLVLRTLVYIKAYLSNSSMNLFLHLLRTWLHWKYSYS